MILPLGTCKHWYNIISYSESLWKLQCLNLDSTDLPGQLKQLSGQTWKEIFQQNYSINRIKNLWKQGTFSNPKSYKELPSQRFCKLDTDSWGQIFEWELDRS
ncbi:A Receptor for Ubiquitination Targets [Mactra antiquata]